MEFTHVNNENNPFYKETEAQTFILYGPTLAGQPV